MALNLRCRACGAVIPGRWPTVLLTTILTLFTLILALIIPTIIGFSTTLSGILIIIGIFLGLVAVYIAARAQDTCHVCQVKYPQRKE